MTNHRKTTLGAGARLLTFGLLVVLVGCVQKVPVGYYAHPGDSIVLGLGGIQRNTDGATNIQASDLTITITNYDTNAVTALTPAAIFKAFPDYSSGLSYQSMSPSAPAGLNLQPFDGGWFVNVTLPSSLSPGSYGISITSPTGKLVNTLFNNGTYAEGDLTQIPLQIEATPSGLVHYYSSLNRDYNSQFAYYPTAYGRLDVSPPAAALANLTSVGGLQLVITYPAANYDATLPLIALPYSHNPSIQLAQNTVDNGDGTKSLVVLLSAPHGFVASANRTPLTPVLSDLSLSFFFFPASGVGTSSTQQLADFQIDQSRSHYYDIDGNVIAALQPVMTFQ